MIGPKRRGVNEILREILSTGFEGTQEDISRVLRDKGVDVNQSTVSRALRRIGAVKQAEGDKVLYRLPQEITRANYTGSISDLIASIDRNEVMVVIRTVPGSASFVGEYLDHAALKYKMGTVAGDDTMLIVPRSVEKIGDLLDEIKRAIKG